jgi:hypothetical protein
VPRKEIRISVPRLYPFGAFGEWILDLNRTRISGEPAWTTTDRLIGGYISWNGNEASTGNRGRLFSWSNTVGRIYEEATGTTANGSALQADYTGPVMTSGIHWARFLQYFTEYQPATGTLTGEALINGQSQGSKTLTVSGNVLLYGSTTYGASVYGGGRTRQQLTQMLPMTAEGNTIQIKFRYSGTTAFRIYDYLIDLVPEAHARGL